MIASGAQPGKCAPNCPPAVRDIRASPPKKASNSHTDGTQDVLRSPEPIDAFNAEVRFNGYTFRDLPETDRSLLRNVLDESPIIASTKINDKPRDQELDERYLAKYGRPRPRGGLHGGLGEAVYIYLAGVAVIASKKAVEKVVDELTKRIFEWLDERYKRRPPVAAVHCFALCRHIDLPLPIWESLRKSACASPGGCVSGTQGVALLIAGFPLLDSHVALIGPGAVPGLHPEAVFLRPAAA
jgi:hypothetical protein